MNRSTSSVVKTLGDGTSYLSGLKGDRGSSGPTGPMGPAGPVGPIGATGATGATGPVGVQGPIGPSGYSLLFSGVLPTGTGLFSLASSNMEGLFFPRDFVVLQEGISDAEGTYTFLPSVEVLIGDSSLISQSSLDKLSSSGTFQTFPCLSGKVLERSSDVRVSFSNITGKVHVYLYAYKC